MKAIVASSVVVILLGPVLWQWTAPPKAIGWPPVPSLPMAEDPNVSAWTEWPSFGGWKIVTLNWSKTGIVLPEHYSVEFVYSEYPDWPTLTGVDLDDPENTVISSLIKMQLIGDTNGDGRVTAADYGVVKENIGARAADPNDYGGGLD